MDEELLQKAIDLAKVGDKNGAIEILEEFVKQDPKSEKGWLWLATCYDNVEDKKHCLQKTLEINPNNQKATQALKSLTTETQEPEVSELKLNNSQPISSRFEGIIKVAAFTLCAFYGLQIISPVWPIELMAFSGSNIAWVPGEILYFPVDNGTVLFLIILVTYFFNVFLKNYGKRILGGIWILIGQELALSTFILGINLVLPEWQNAFWGVGNIGLVIVGLGYLVLGTTYLSSKSTMKNLSKKGLLTITVIILLILFLCACQYSNSPIEPTSIEPTIKESTTKEWEYKVVNLACWHSNESNKTGPIIEYCTEGRPEILDDLSTFDDLTVLLNRYGHDGWDLVTFNTKFDFGFEIMGKLDTSQNVNLRFNLLVFKRQKQ